MKKRRIVLLLWAVPAFLFWPAAPHAQEPAASAILEKWPNGAMKSEEPTARGVREGLARYWHENGQLYGEIPWKDGQKHGSFKLFRPDGTIEQQLSYKAGQVDGVCRWYDEAGRLKQEARYEAGRVVSNRLVAGGAAARADDTVHVTLNGDEARDAAKAFADAARTAVAEAKGAAEAAITRAVRSILVFVGGILLGMVLAVLVLLGLRKGVQ